jgi:hypothetical protein
MIYSSPVGRQYVMILDASGRITNVQPPGVTATTIREATIPNPVPRQFFFRDIDGNRFLIVQPG